PVVHGLSPEEIQREDEAAQHEEEHDRFMAGEEREERGPGHALHDPADADIRTALHDKRVEIVPDEHRDGRQSAQRIELLIAMACRRGPGHDAARGLRWPSRPYSAPSGSNTSPSLVWRIHGCSAASSLRMIAARELPCLPNAALATCTATRQPLSSTE